MQGKRDGERKHERKLKPNAHRITNANIKLTVKLLNC